MLLRASVPPDTVLLVFHSSEVILIIVLDLFQAIYETLVSLTLQLQQGDPLFADSTFKQVLYRCLVSTIHSYNKDVGPLTPVTAELLSKGIADKCPQVSN